MVNKPKQMSWRATPVIAIFLPDAASLLMVAGEEEVLMAVSLIAPRSWTMRAMMSKTTKIGVSQRGEIQRSLSVLASFGTTWKTMRPKTT